MKRLPSNFWISGITQNDTLSQIRGIGRYSNGLILALSDIPQEDLVNQKNVAIESFFNILASPIFPIFFMSSHKRIAVIHDVIPLEFPDYYPIGIRGYINLAINRLLLRGYHHVVTDSETSAHAISTHLTVPSRKITVVFPYSTLQELSIPSEATLLPTNIKPYEYLLYVGDVNWHKNLTTMAKAVIAQNKTLVCVGGAFSQTPTSHPWQKHHQEFRELARKYPKQVIFVGYVNDHVLASLYRFACANILVSHNEGFGYSYVEAGAFGTPSILSDKPIFHEISDRKGALFVDPENVATIAEAINHVYSNRVKRDSLGAEAKERSGAYSRTRFRTDWLNIINHL